MDNTFQIFDISLWYLCYNVASRGIQEIVGILYTVIVLVQKQLDTEFYGQGEYILMVSLNCISSVLDIPHPS